MAQSNEKLAKSSMSKKGLYLVKCSEDKTRPFLVENQSFKRYVIIIASLHNFWKIIETCLTKSLSTFYVTTVAETSGLISRLTSSSRIARTTGSTQSM